MIIGIAGPMGAGKSTVAEYLQTCEPARILPFAAPLKKFAKQLGWNGAKDEKGRRLLQLLGTDCARDCIDQDIWLTHWTHEIMKLGNWELQYTWLITDDIRFVNETNLVRRLGGKVIHVYRPGFVSTSHRSEGGVPFEKGDLILHNDGALNQLHTNIDGLKGQLLCSA